MGYPIRLALVGKDEQFRLTLGRLLEKVDDVRIVGETAGGAETLAMLRRSRPDVVLLDLATLPADGLQVVEQVGRHLPHVGIIVLNAPGQEPLVLAALQEGALGHLVKGPGRPDEIVAAIRAAGRNEAVLSPQIAGHILDNVVPRPPADDKTEQNY